MINKTNISGILFFFSLDKITSSVWVLQYVIRLIITHEISLGGSNAFQVVSPSVHGNCYRISFESGNDIRLHVFHFCFTVMFNVLSFLSDNFQPFTSFTIESSNILVTGSLFFLCISLVFFYGKLTMVIYFHQFHLSHAFSNELSFPVVSDGFSSFDKTEKRLVVWICWSCTGSSI